MSANKMYQFLEQLNISKKDYSYILKNLKREPNELELYLFSAMYSEHCGYRHSKKYLSRLPRKFKNKKAVFYKENAGGINIGEHSILFKMESHNHPSAVEPYNGAATGIGGIIRDVLAMNARPIALSDSLKFGDLKDTKTKIIFEGVINGISAYGNCIGVPTLEGECDFDNSYKDNPLVNVMALGIAKTEDIVTSQAQKDSLIVLLGSATMKDGIGGAAFASKDLNEEFEENRISVQIADPLMEKKLIEATLEILSKKLALSCQDCGAAGILSSTSEMAFKGNCGMNLYLDKVHLAQKNMKPWEIMLSETQERMMFCVKKEQLKSIEELSDKYEIPYSIIGETIDEKEYKLFWDEKLIADLPTELISDAPFVKVTPKKPKKTKTVKAHPISVEQQITNLVEDPSFASKEWIYSQYDYTVGSKTVFPPKDKGASAIWLYEEDCFLGIATASRPKDTNLNPFEGTINTVYEAAKKLISSGFEPMGITNCLNFANPTKPETMWQFKQSVSGMAKVLKKLQIPVCSGNVSFYNESKNTKVYPTPTITMIGICKKFEDIKKRQFDTGETLLLLGKNTGFCVDFEHEDKLKKIIENLNSKNLIKTCLSVSKGGVFGTIFKGCTPKKLGAKINVSEKLFEEHQGHYLLGINDTEAVSKLLDTKKTDYQIIGEITEKDFLIADNCFDSEKLFEKYKNRLKDLLS